MIWGGHQKTSGAKTLSSSETCRWASTKTGSASLPHLSVELFLRFIYSSSSTAILLLFSAASLYFTTFITQLCSPVFLLRIVVNQTFPSLESACLPAAESVNAALLGYIQVLLQFSHILFWQCVYVCKYEEHFLTQAAALSLKYLSRSFRGYHFYSPLFS